MYNEKKLRIAMLEAGMTVGQLATAIGINESTLYRKIKGKTEFTLSEMQDICKILGIQGGGIFFDEELA
jgi:DNA-binding Xre family transcriptional regulator